MMGLATDHRANRPALHAVIYGAAMLWACGTVLVIAVEDPSAEDASTSDLRTDRTLMLNEGEGTLDIYDEAFVYDHDKSVGSCTPSSSHVSRESGSHGNTPGDSEFATGCWPLGRLLLHPEEHASAAEWLHTEEWEQLNYSVGNLIAQIDTGVDADGDPIGGGGDGMIVAEELANRVYAALRTWQYETDRIWQEQADKNADGLIGFTEVSSSDSTGVDEGTTATLNRFNFADSNKDGWLSETDIASFRNPLWFSRMHQWALGAMVLELSRDDHQNITREEYTTPDAPDMPFNWEVRVPTYVKEREFKRLDRDDSGSLDLREASQIPEVRLASIITHGVHALLHVCDEDDDGTLSVDEIVSKSTEFANAPPLATRSWEDNDGDTEHVHEDL